MEKGTEDGVRPVRSSSQESQSRRYLQTIVVYTWRGHATLVNLHQFMDRRLEEQMMTTTASGLLFRNMGSWFERRTLERIQTSLHVDGNVNKKVYPYVMSGGTRSKFRSMRTGSTVARPESSEGKELCCHALCAQAFDFTVYVYIFIIMSVLTTRTGHQ